MIDIAKTSDAMRKAIANYQSALDDIKIRVEKGKRAEIRAYAEQHQESLQGYIIRLIEEDSGIKLR